MGMFFTRRRPEPDPELEALVAELDSAQGELQRAYGQFDLQEEPELVESCGYPTSAVQARCNYLIRAIKARGAAAAMGREDGQWT